MRRDLWSAFAEARYRSSDDDASSERSSGIDGLETTAETADFALHHGPFARLTMPLN